MSQAQKKILFADDDQDFLFAVKEFYENSNWKFDFAENGVVALDLAMKDTYDLISLDINMPFMKGNEAIKNIRQMYPDQKIIAFTAISDNEMKVQLLQTGFDEVISKPVSFQQMHSMFKRILNIESEDEASQSDETKAIQKEEVSNIEIKEDDKQAPVEQMQMTAEEAPPAPKPELTTPAVNEVVQASEDKENPEALKMEFMKKYSFSLLQNESKETLIMMMQSLARELFDLKNK